MSKQLLPEPLARIGPKPDQSAVSRHELATTFDLKRNDKRTGKRKRLTRALDCSEWVYCMLEQSSDRRSSRADAGTTVAERSQLMNEYIVAQTQGQT